VLVRAGECVELRIVEQMRVDLRRDVHTRVTELLRDPDQRDAVGESNAGSGVPKSVKGHQRCALGSDETRAILH
jgi:hypothetical protein